MLGSAASCVLITSIVLLIGSQQGQPTIEPVAPTTQPAAERPAAPRAPDQADIYRNLLRDIERPPRILPSEPPDGTAAPRDGSPESPGQLLLDGDVIVDRPGRLVQVEGRSMFRLNASDREPLARTLELNKNGLLEAMEEEAVSGSAEFHITAVVSQYRGANYLTLLKYRRQIPHGNLAP